MLLAQLQESLPLSRLSCGGNMRIALVADAAPVEQIISHIGELRQPQLIRLARGPPTWEDALELLPDFGAMAQSEQDLSFDHRIRG